MPKQVQMPDGSTISFPNDMDDATIHAEGLKYIQSKQPKLQTGSGMLAGTGISPERPAADPAKTNFIIDMLRPLLAGAAGSGGAMIGGPAGAVAGYGGADAILQHLKTKSDNGIVASAAGMEPGGVASTLTNSAEQYGLGKIGEAILSKVKPVINAARNVDQPELMRLTPTTSQALEGSGYSKLASVTKAAEDLAVSNKMKALNRTAGKGFSEALEVARNNDLSAFDVRNLSESFSTNPQQVLGEVGKDMPFGEGSLTPVKITPGEQYQPAYKGKPFQPSTKPTVTAGEPNTNTGAESLAALDRVIADPKKLQDTLSRAAELGTGDNLRRTLGGYKFADIMNNATTRDVSGNILKLDPQKIANEWADPAMQDSLGLLYNKEQKANITQFFENIATTQDKVGPGSYRKLWLMEGGVGLATGFLTGNPIHGAGGIAGVYLGGQVLSRLLTNPKTARIAVALAGGGPLGVSDQLAGKLISRALQGSAVALINADGSKTPGTFGSDGSLVPLGR